MTSRADSDGLPTVLVHQCAGFFPRTLKQIADAKVRSPFIEVGLVELVELNSHDSDNIIPLALGGPAASFVPLQLALVDVVCSCGSLQDVRSNPIGEFLAIVHLYKE